MQKFSLMLIAGLMFTMAGFSQSKSDSSGKVGKTVNKVGNKTANVAVNTTSAIVDKKYKGKAGPDGQTIYINNKSQYYYIDAKGKKVFVKKEDLKDKE